MTRSRHYRQKTRQKLREVAEKLSLTLTAVHDAEVRGIRTTRPAAKYAAALPGITWQDLLEPPRVSSGE